MFSDKSSLCDNQKKFCFVNQLDITNKNLNKQDSSSLIINFENNSFKKDSKGFLLTLKDPSNTQSNCNSISTKTNTKIISENFPKNDTHDNVPKFIEYSPSWRKESYSLKNNGSKDNK